MTGKAAPPGDLVLLAAGRSSRMGTTKGLLDFHGRPWVLEQRRRWPGRVCLVVAPADEELYRATGFDGELVVNMEPWRGQFSSVQVGLAQCFRGGTAWIAPVDVPLPDARALTLIRDALVRGGSEGDAAIPTFEGRGGHPVALAAHYWPFLLECSAADRLDTQLRRAHTVRVPMADRWTAQNLNTPDAWADLLAATQRGEAGKAHATGGSTTTPPPDAILGADVRGTKDANSQLVDSQGGQPPDG